MDNNGVEIYLKSPLHIGSVLSEIHDFIGEGLRRFPEHFKIPLRVISSGKTLIGADLLAEQRFSSLVKEGERGRLLSVEGEESLANRKLNFRGSDKIHLLCDIIDGTDLYVRGFSNWCSAVVAFNPSERRVVCSHVYVVGDRNSTLYSASADGDKPFTTQFREVVTAGDKGPPVAEMFEAPKHVEVGASKPFGEATICCYGQKFKNLEALGQLFKSSESKELLLRKEMENARFHTLAGNPMMCRIIDGSVDIVFDIFGQAPHDVVPGAFIALKAGAVMYDLGANPRREDRRVEIEDFIEFLFEPNNERMKYVIASGEALAESFLNVLRSAKII
ncbi:MAG: Inositol monophosphatase family [Rhodobacteraceae bacterium HLUCCO07]|nr:MAG: Inositol monophosphatase family [Rhodobacteraceae bacterium HLUCCO07]